MRKKNSYMMTDDYNKKQGNVHTHMFTTYTYKMYEKNFLREIYLLLCNQKKKTYCTCVSSFSYKILLECVSFSENLKNRDYLIFLRTQNRTFLNNFSLFASF